MRWQKDVYDMVEAVCRQQGLEVERGVSKREKRIDTELFKKETQLEELNTERLGQEYLVSVRQNEVRELELEVSDLKREKDALDKRLIELQENVGELQGLQGKVRVLEEENKRLRRTVDLFKRAFSLAKSYLETKGIRFSDGKVGTYWDVVKSTLFQGLGKKDYDDFQAVAHGEDLRREKPKLNKPTNFGFDR